MKLLKHIESKVRNCISKLGIKNFIGIHFSYKKKVSLSYFFLLLFCVGLIKKRNVAHAKVTNDLHKRDIITINTYAKNKKKT
jgi:hypothetical protein